MFLITGDAPPVAEDEDFTRHHDALQRLLTKQMAVYEDEERALRVMMSEQVDAEMTHQQHAQQKQEVHDCGKCGITSIPKFNV